MEPGELITDGIVWRGIVGQPYEATAEGHIAFSKDAFFDPVERDPDTGHQTIEPSVIVAVLEPSPENGLQNLRRAGRDPQALAGVAVESVCAAVARRSEGGPTPSRPTASTAPIMTVVYFPETAPNGFLLKSHAVVRPDPRWHPTQGPLKKMRLALAELASDFQKHNGWVLSPEQSAMIPRP